jgi:hypothetical protein
MVKNVMRLIQIAAVLTIPVKVFFNRGDIHHTTRWKQRRRLFVHHGRRTAQAGACIRGCEGGS